MINGVLFQKGAKMVDLKNEPTSTPAPKKSRGLTMTAVKNWLSISEKKNVEFQKVPESFLRSIRRRSLRVKRTKSLAFQEKRKSGKLIISIKGIARFS